MSLKQSILEIGHELGLPASTIEKDYVLSWVLVALSKMPTIADEWVFKGGTCIKKCYMGTYRFSEDLDFTLLEPTGLNKQALERVLLEMAGWVRRNSGVEIPPQSIRVKVYPNQLGGSSAHATFNYFGPLKQRRSPPRVKLDLTADEPVLLPPSNKVVLHAYDEQFPARTVPCYAIEELYAEKLRALADRARPRDLYDVVCIFEEESLPLKRGVVRGLLVEKCGFKGMEIPNLDSILNHPFRHELETEWANMLGRQLPHLPPMDAFLKRLTTVFDWCSS